jgi:hypothetical protein
MDLVLFEQNKPLVLRALGEGDFDYIEAASEVFETEFFRFIKGKKILDQLSQSYPSPRKKEEVPLWVYVASNLSMRLHGVHSFNSYPLMVRAGGMLNAFGPRAGRKVSHPDSGDITIVCEGFNKKNHFDRETPCDQDFLRKVAKDTDTEALMKWFCDDVQRVFRNHGVFDEEGIFIGDGSYLFVPDNPNYEGSVRLLFDEHHHPISLEQYKELSDERKLRCQWRRCYKMVTLLHTNRALEFFIFVGVRVVPGNEHECPILYELVREFAEGAGDGVMKRLILDRGFIDGEEISRCKKDYGIDILIPVRRNMDIYGDAMALFRLPEVEWVRCKEAPAEMRKLARPRPKAIVKREKKRQEKLKDLKEAKPSLPLEKTLVKTETAAIGQFTSWQSCTVPLSVVANREHYADGHEKIWLLIDTKEVHNSCQAREDYHLRTATEERYRQLKCFADLTRFTSRAFSMVANQVVFSMLSYNLLQLYLLRQARKELNKKIPPRIRQQLLPSDNHIIVYWKNYYALFTPLEFAGTLVTLGEQARKKIAEKSRRLRRELNGAMTNPRAP